MSLTDQSAKSLKVLNRLGIGSILIGIAAGLAKAWATYWLGPPSVPGKDVAVVAEAVPETMDSLLRSSPISLMQWQTAVTADFRDAVQRERMFRDYLGREVIWEGYFDQVHELPEGTPDRAYSLVMHEARTTLFSEHVLGPPFIRCFFGADAGPQLAGLKRGDWIVIRGTISDPMLLGSLLCTDLKNCEIRGSSEIRNPLLAAVPKDVVPDAGSPVRR